MNNRDAYTRAVKAPRPTDEELRELLAAHNVNGCLRIDDYSTTLAREVLERREAEASLRAELARLREGIAKSVSNMEGRGMGDWPEAKALRALLTEGEG